MTTRRAPDPVSHQVIIDRIELMDARLTGRIDQIDSRLQETRETVVRIEALQSERATVLQRLGEKVDAMAVANAAPPEPDAGPWWRRLIPPQRILIAVLAGAGCIYIIDRLPEIIAAWRQ